MFSAVLQKYYSLHQSGKYKCRPRPSLKFSLEVMKNTFKEIDFGTSDIWKQGTMLEIK